MVKKNYLLITLLGLTNCVIGIEAEPKDIDTTGKPKVKEESPQEVLESDPQAQFAEFTSDPEDPNSLYNQREQNGNRTLAEIADENAFTYTGEGFYASYNSDNEDGKSIKQGLFSDLEEKLREATGSEDKKTNQERLDAIIDYFADNPTMVYFNQLVGDDSETRSYLFAVTNQDIIYTGYLTEVDTTYPKIREIKEREADTAFEGLEWKKNL